MVELVKLLMVLLMQFQTSVDLFIKSHYGWLLKQVEIQLPMLEIKTSAEITLKGMELANKLWLRAFDLAGTAMGLTCLMLIIWAIAKILTTPHSITVKKEDK